MIVINKIAEAMTEFEVEHGKPPTVLYFGKRQNNDLYRAADMIGDVMFANKSMGLDRTEVMGLPVYVVDAEDYIACS